MMTFDLISDLSLLTTIPKKTLQRLGDQGAECLCHDVLESIQSGETCTDIDIDIGTIKVIIEDDELHYRFAPSRRLEEMLINSIRSGEDPLVSHIEDSISSRILNTYKDLI